MSYALRQNPAHSNNFTVGRPGNTINKIVIHHAATTDFDGIARTFQNPNRGASAHYGVGRDNNVDQYVQEKDMAWHAGTKNPATNPNPTAIGIENVNMSLGDWAIDERTVTTLIELCVDIVRRNPGIGKLVVGKNFFGHKDFAPTACPSQLYARLQEIANRVNAIVGGSPDPAPQVPSRTVDQILHVGESFRFKESYRVDNMAIIGGIWQIYTQELCPKGFTWDDNGIPVGPVNEVGGGVGNTADQRLQIGSRYNIPGTFTVLDIGQYQDRWLAKIDMGGWKLWVDVATVTEV